MRTSFLETLLAVHRFGSFTQAARSRNMTLSALSMQMKTLEEDLQAQLFDRSFRPPKLTPLGEKVADEARLVIEAEARLRSHCSGEALNGRFHLGFVTSLAARALPDFLAAAGEAAPNARFSFETGLSETLCQGVRAGRLDAALVTDIPEATTGLVSDRLFDEEMVLVVPMAQHSLGLEQMAARLPFFHFQAETGIGRLIAQFLAQIALERGQTVSLDNIEAIVACVRRGLGFSLLPLGEVERYGQGAVHRMSCPPRPLFRTIALVTRPDPLSEIWRGALARLAGESLGAQPWVRGVAP